MGSADTERNAPEFFILLLGSALGMALMVSTANLLMIVIAIETASLPKVGLPTVFVVALVSATLVPMGSEPVVPMASPPARWTSKSRGWPMKSSSKH